MAATVPARRQRLNPVPLLFYSYFQIINHTSVIILKCFMYKESRQVFIRDRGASTHVKDACLSQHINIVSQA